MSERHDGLDAARAYAMILVVATHTALSFMVTPIGWAVQDRSQHLAVDLYVWVVRAMVMPTFFWLSGYFARAVFEGGGLRGFVRHRVLRILLPFVLALLPVSFALSALWDWGRDVTLRGTVAANVPKIRESEIPIILGHLWYLWYLLWMSAIAVLVRAIGVRAPRGIAVVALPAALGIGTLLAIRSLQCDTPLGFIPDPSILAYMGAAFWWGWMVHARPEQLTSYAKHLWWLLAAAPILLGIAAITLYEGLAAIERPPVHAILASGLFSVVAIAAFLGACVRFARRPHRLLRLASESSYWFYIAHLPLVVALQIALANVAVPGIVKFVVIVGVTSAACLATYELLVRRTRLRKVFG